MRILVVGGGGREHALAWKMRRSPLVTQLYCAPGNAGIASIADCVPIEPADIVEIADFASKIRVDLTVVGPELPLNLGLADELAKRGLKVFGPARLAAEIENSKVFAKEFMQRHDIPTAPFKVFRSQDEALAHLASPATRWPLVVKADGLAAGKGVVVAAGRAEAEAAVHRMMGARAFGSSGDAIVVEECLEGPEVSVFALCDGARLMPWPACQDFKRALDGDEGPNTGGMGSYSPSVYLEGESFREIVSRILAPTIAGLRKEGRPYVGMLYAGLMLTAEGPKVLEFNARFGDPETEALLPRMKSDIVPLLAAAAGGGLGSVPPPEWLREAAVTVVAAAAGYPDSYAKGNPITGIDAAERDGALVFHCGTKRTVTGETLSNGGRVLAVTALGASIAEARRRAYDAVGRIAFDGMRYRRDIAEKAAARSSGGKEADA